MGRLSRRIRMGGISLLVASLMAGAAAGCRRAPAAESGGPDSAGIRISLVAPVFSPPAGDGRLVIRVADEDDRPINEAALHVRGDMTHAGMTPILATAETGEDGIYRIPVRWTMAGDWILTVEATLRDGRRAAQTFNLTVTGEDELCFDGP